MPNRHAEDGELAQPPTNHIPSMGYQDQFNLPAQLGRMKINSDIKIVPFGASPGRAEDIVLSSSPTKQRRPSRGGDALDADGGLFELFGGRQFWPEAAGIDHVADKNKDFMVPSPPRYTFTEERPQTRGNQSHQGAGDAAGTGTATQSGRRSRRVPRNKRLEALSPPDSGHSKPEPQIVEPLNDMDILNSGVMNRQMTAGSKEYDQRADQPPPWHNPRGHLISPQSKGVRADRIVIVDSAATP